MPQSRVRHSRRIFLAGSAGALLLGRAGADAWASHVTPQPARRRRLLKEPGPMLPPVPAILLTVHGGPDEPDEISVVWTFVVNGEPPQVGVSIAHEHRAQRLVEQHKEFVLNVPVSSMVRAFDVVDMNSSKPGDKFALSGLTRGKASRVDAPTVEEAPIHVECRVFNEVAVPPARKVFLADVVATCVVEGACDAQGRLVVPAFSYFGMTAGSGEFYTMGKRIGHIGQSVGRADIKY